MTPRVPELRPAFRAFPGIGAGWIVAASLLFLAVWWVRAADPVANATGRDRWGPLTVGDRVGLKEVGAFHNLQVGPQAGEGPGYRLQRIAVTDGSIFLVLSPPVELQPAQGL